LAIVVSRESSPASSDCMKPSRRSSQHRAGLGDDQVGAAYALPLVRRIGRASVALVALGAVLD